MSKRPESILSSRSSTLDAKFLGSFLCLAIDRSSSYLCYSFCFCCFILASFVYFTVVNSFDGLGFFSGAGSFLADDEKLKKFLTPENTLPRLLGVGF